MLKFKSKRQFDEWFNSLTDDIIRVRLKNPMTIEETKQDLLDLFYEILQNVDFSFLNESS